MLDADACYAALKSRDRRFDGRFFVGVHSTRVFCRPVCPARTPNREGVDFFASAAAAREAGFRACLRCRPETAPQTSAWIGTAATVHRALRLIEEGALDDATVPELSERLGISARHLRSLFRKHVGASPSAVAHSRRLRHARLLLTATELPMTDVALLAGFSSVRRFNDAVLKGFGRSPTQLRTAGGRATLTVRLSVRPPYRYDALLRYLQARAVPGVERVRDGVWSHGVRVRDGAGAVHVRHDPEHHALQLELSESLASALPEMVRRIRRAFDVDADPQAVSERLAPLTAPVGTRLPGAFDRFAVAVRMILGQQISVKAATTLSGRLVQRWAEPPIEGTELAAFPAPSVLADAPLQEIGLTQRRADTLRVFSTAVANGDLSLRSDRPLDELITELCRLPGIGPWTASMLAMRVFGEPDAFPSGDLVLRRALQAFDVDPTEAWRPWRAYGALALWENAHTLETR
ncbi:MAG: helix-turn-helix domain-containing protein [Myxococcales bacterium]|nr:helix-turn-helix domain-containing protein [Myxococcales bacterium]